MGIQILIGLIMTAITVALGSTAMVLGAHLLRQRRDILRQKHHVAGHIVIVTLVTTALVIAMFTLMALWAVLLISLGIFDRFEPAIYFSMIAFTTLGFGDLILPEDWRLLSGFIAINGFLLFGLNTAFVFEVLRKLREHID